MDNLEIVDGVCTLKFNTFDEYYKFYYEHMDDLRGYVWRGQKNAKWALIPTLDRILIDRGLDVLEDTKKHYENFLYATRGRRDKTAVNFDNEEEWWALGQHNGLATPLLDWTTSPFVAAFFAFHKESFNEMIERGIFAIHQESFKEKSSELIKSGKDSEVVKFIKPLSYENSRLVNQSALFTKSPSGVDLEDWTRKYFSGVNDSVKLFRIYIPDSEREICLRLLNRMNINYLTLFPDLYGASKHCNMIINISNYMM